VQWGSTQIRAVPRGEARAAEQGPADPAPEWPSSRRGKTRRLIGAVALQPDDVCGFRLNVPVRRPHVLIDAVRLQIGPLPARRRCGYSASDAPPACGRSTGSIRRRAAFASTTGSAPQGPASAPSDGHRDTGPAGPAIRSARTALSTSGWCANSPRGRAGSPGRRHRRRGAG
jgi:hypothetical protein